MLLSIKLNNRIMEPSSLGCSVLGFVGEGTGAGARLELGL